MSPRMSKALRSALLSFRDLVLSAGPLAFLAVGLLVLAYWWLNPTPPKSVTLATGPAQSAYEEFGKRYQKALAAEGIEVRLLPSDGSSANLQLLRDGQADLAFVQGGTAELLPDDPENLVSLGSLFVEPVWVFYRTEAAQRMYERPRLDGLRQLRGMRVNVGSEGSGVPWLMNQLLEANRLEAGAVTMTRLEETPATVAFLAGKLDALVFASAPESLMVQMLLQTLGVQLLDIAQHEAYARRFPFLSPVTLPRGGGGPGQQRAGTRRAHGGVHHLAAGAGIHPPGLAHAVCTARATGAQHGRLVQPRAGISQHAPQRTADCQRGRAGDQRAGAHAAALPALLAGQPD